MADIPDMPPVPCPDCMHPTTFDEDAFVCSSCGQAFAHPHGMALSQWRELWRAWTAGCTVVHLPDDGHCTKCGQPFPSNIREVVTDGEPLPEIALDHPTRGRIRWDWDQCQWVPAGVGGGV